MQSLAEEHSVSQDEGRSKEFALQLKVMSGEVAMAIENIYSYHNAQIFKTIIFLRMRAILVSKMHCFLCDSTHLILSSCFHHTYLIIHSAPTITGTFSALKCYIYFQFNFQEIYISLICQLSLQIYFCQWVVVATNVLFPMINEYVVLINLDLSVLIIKSQGCCRLE